MLAYMCALHTARLALIMSVLANAGPAFATHGHAASNSTSRSSYGHPHPRPGSETSNARSKVNFIDPGTRNGYPSEGNYICIKHFGNDTYPLPCRAPRDDWDFQLKNEFVITAWSLPAYKAAHFNLLLGGQIVRACMENGTTPNPATRTEGAECVFGQLPVIESYGLKFAWNLGVFPLAPGVENAVAGGAASLGAIVEGQPGGYPSSLEVAWVVQELERRNLSHNVVQYFLHDDDASTSTAVTEAISWLRNNAPHITPQTNTFPDANPEQLYASRQFVFAPEEYSVSGTNGSKLHALQMVQAELSQFANNKYLTDRYRLDAWPLINLMDTASDSLVRAQTYGTLAFGARGIYYYCWGHGIWNISMPDGNVNKFGKPAPNYPFVKASNADLAVFGTTLLKAKHIGTIRSEGVNITGTVLAAEGLVVGSINASAVIGVYSDQSDTDTGYLMVVRMEVGMTIDEVPPAIVEFTVATECGNIEAVLGGMEGFARKSHESIVVQRHKTGSTTVRAEMLAGGGLLYRIHGTGCLQKLRRTRAWWYDPRSINLRHTYLDTSLKAATYSSWNTQNYKRPGGIAGDESSFIIGGSYWEHGGWKSEEDARDWADAGFSMVSLSGRNLNILMESLQWATPYGRFVMATAQDSARFDSNALQSIANDLSCHTNFAGFVLSNSSTNVTAISSLSSALKDTAYWTLPVVLSAATPSRIADLARVGVGFAPLKLPDVPRSNNMIEPWTATMANIIKGLSDMSSNASVDMTMAVALDPCSTESDSILRYSAYLSLIYGAQGLWWEGIGKCAPIGTPKFGLIAAINNRIAQWADPLFLKNGRNYVVLGAWSTSSVEFPPLKRDGDYVHFLPPGRSSGTGTALVQNMSKDMIAVQLNSTTNAEMYILFLSTSVSTVKGGSPIRNLLAELRRDVGITRFIEQDIYQGYPNSCDLYRSGFMLPLQLPGGGVQLVQYEKFENPKPHMILDEVWMR